MKTLKDIKDMKGKKALVRVDYNVPIKSGKILDTRRIDASFETIKFLQKKGMSVLLIAHLGDGKASLKPVAKYLSNYFNVNFVTNPIIHPEKKGTLLQASKDENSKNTVILFENIRRYKEEEKNDITLSKALAKLGDIFVNDAFSVSHRKHASVVGVTKYLPSFAGVQLEKEISSLSKLLNNNKHPFLFILGGAKFGTKIPLIKRFVDKADNLVISGAILNSFYKVAGFDVGLSVFENGYEKEIKKLLSSPKILLPTDVVVKRGNKKIVVFVDEIKNKDVIVDIGSDSIRLISEKIKKSKVIVWNGPTGWYEKGFISGTLALAEAINGSSATSIIGGGDTGAVVEKIIGSSASNKKIFISTGGGATLEYLANGSLVGLQCLN